MFSGKKNSVIAEKLKNVMSGFGIKNLDIEVDNDKLLLDLIKTREENRDSLRILRSSISRI